MTNGVPEIAWGDVSADKLLPALHARIHDLEVALTAIGFDAKAAKKRRFPSKRQASVLNGITRALCVETIDPWKENRVRFYHPLLHEPDAKLLSLPFANPVSAFGGFDDSGVNWVPPAGSTLMVFFEGGVRDAPFYIGTTWHRDRGPRGRDLTSVFPSREWDAIYADSRAGNFMHGPDDGSQVLPPWNTESYNAGDIDQIEQFTEDPLEQKRMTYPNIYGFKTPEKHMLKFVDGNAKCNRRWKRVELMSGDGNWMIFKDDHLHYGGQWAHPDCGVSGLDVSICTDNDSKLPYLTNLKGRSINNLTNSRSDSNDEGDFQGKPIEKGAQCGPQCDGGGQAQCSKIIGGHTPTPCDPQTNWCGRQTGANRFFKQRNECRPYRGPQTNQNNRCDLPQSGIQFLTLSGHTRVMDDSVEEPRGAPGWKRSNKAFDYGCNDKYLGRVYDKTAHGHTIMMSDVEGQPKVRGDKNYIKLLTATGNRIELNDHTVCPSLNGDPSCPPCYAGESRGITMQSTSRHVIRMIDHMNQQCSPVRQEGGVPVAKATQAFIEIESGYGLGMRFNDDNSQEKTQSQWIQITNPQCGRDATADTACNSPPCEGGGRGPHFLRFQGRPKGTPGVVFLRAGGHSIRQTFDMDIVLVGDKDCNPADKFTYVSKKHVRVTEGSDFRYSGDMHVLFAENRIVLMAGRDCEPGPGKTCGTPCIFPVVIARCPVFCPLTGILHWTEMAISERVFASGWSPPCPTSPGSTGPCNETPPQTTVDTGTGPVMQSQNRFPTGTPVDPNAGATVGASNPGRTTI
jgi:hypothetical protein